MILLSFTFIFLWFFNHAQSPDIRLLGERTAFPSSRVFSTVEHISPPATIVPSDIYQRPIRRAPLPNDCPIFMEPESCVDPLSCSSPLTTNKTCREYSQPVEYYWNKMKNRSQQKPEQFDNTRLTSQGHFCARKTQPEFNAKKAFNVVCT